MNAGMTENELAMHGRLQQLPYMIFEG